LAKRTVEGLISHSDRWCARILLVLARLRLCEDVSTIDESHQQLFENFFEKNLAGTLAD